MHIISRLHTFMGERSAHTTTCLAEALTSSIQSKHAPHRWKRGTISLILSQVPLSLSLHSPGFFQSPKCYHFTRETASSIPDVLDCLMLQYTQISNLNCFFKDHTAVGSFPVPFGFYWYPTQTMWQNCQVVWALYMQLRGHTIACY